MVKKAAALLCAVLCAAGIAACSTENPEAGEQSSAPSSSTGTSSETASVTGTAAGVSEAESAPLSDVEEKALAAGKEIFDWIYPTDEALNSDISLVAIDTTNLGLSDAAKVQFLQYIEEQSGYPVRDTTATALKEEGLLDDDGFRTGILLSLSFTIDGDTATFSADKYRSPLGAIGTADGRMDWDGTAWKIDEEKAPMYIS